MNPPHHIHYLQRQEIDPLKWNACVEAAPNGLIYGHSFYLDSMTGGQWDALVLEDYRAVMPLTWNRKFGFHYLYQPFCTPCLGIFGDDLQNTLVAAFLQAIPRKFKYWDIDLNEANFPLNEANFPSSDTHGSPSDRPVPAAPLTQSPLPDGKGSTGFPLKMTPRVNHFLHLDKKGEELEQGYNRLAKRMCKKAMTDNVQVIQNIGPRDVIDLYRKEYSPRHPRVRSESYERLAAYADKAFIKDQAKTYLALFPDGGIAAFYLVLSDKRSVYSTLGGSTRKGKEKGAFYLLTDAALKEHAGSPRVFRFEGSDIPGIASFDASFGSAPVHYPHVLMNKLPFPINLLK